MFYNAVLDNVSKVYGLLSFECLAWSFDKLELVELGVGKSGII